MKIWLDDKRPMPEGYTLWAKTADAAIHVIAITLSLVPRYVEKISFDHDLGEGKTGYDVATYIEYLAFKGLIPQIEWEIHTDNPAGRKRIRLAMQSADRFWNTK